MSKFETIRSLPRTGGSPGWSSPPFEPAQSGLLASALTFPSGKTTQMALLEKLATSNYPPYELPPLLLQSGHESHGAKDRIGDGSGQHGQTGQQEEVRSDDFSLGE